MKNNNNKIKKKLLALSIIFILLLSYSPIFNNLFLNPNLSAIVEEDISIETGFNVYDGYPYWYSGTFYDDADFEFAWTTAEIQFEHITTGLSYDYSITDLDNSETQYPSNSSFQMVNGTHIQNGTLNAVDDDYHAFDSTYDKLIAEQPDNFKIGKGNSTYDGDLEIIDGNYTTFTSDIKKHYLGTYSFTNDTNGIVPTNYTDESGDGCSATVNQGIFGHEKVLELNDTSNSNVAMISNTFIGQTSGTIEWWWMDTSTSYAFMHILGGGDVVIYLSSISNSYHYDLGGWQNVRARDLNTWYHHRIDFECGAGGYMGLPADTYDWYIDNVIEANNIAFRASFNPDDIDVFRTTSDGAGFNYKYYLDAFGYSWDPDYNVGDNQDIEPLNLEIEVNINLNSFSNLNELYLVYAYLTNISLTCNYSIYNFDDSVYDIIENDVNLAFINSYFLLNSSYYNNTNDLILSFEMYINAEFEMRLDRLLVRKPSYLNFSTSVSFDILTNLLQMDIESYQRSNITQLINMSIWSYVLSSWVNLNSSSYITTFQLLQCINTDFSDYINSNGDVSLSYYGVNITDAFRFELDVLNVILWRKTIVQYEATLYLRGVWGYRFVLDDGLGTSYNTTWIYFDVIAPIDNFHAISESDQTTRWILQGSDISAVEDFHDDINTDYWNLVDVSTADININTNPTDDSYVKSDTPTTNYGSSVNLYMLNGAPDYETFIKYEFPYLTGNYTTNSTLTDWCGNAGEISVYKTTDFSENTIIWDNKPSTGEYMDKTTVSAGWNDIDLGEPFDYYQFTTLLADMVQINSKEGTAGYRPIIKHYLTKNYFGSGYMYMQTDTTELISLKSQDYTTHYNLSSGDYFEIDFQTSSDSQIYLILLKDGVVQKTLTLSQSGNTKFNRRAIRIIVDEFMEFDQLKVSSTFEDADNVKVYDIKTYKYTLIGESVDFYVDPDGSGSVYLSPNIYNLRIYEGGYEKINENVTISSIDYYYVYEPIETIQCRITLFNTEDEYLQFEDYHINVNRSLNGVYGDFELLEPIFLVDEETYIYIDVYDRFDAFIDNFTRLASEYMDLELSVYSLQIKSLLGKATILDVNSTHVYPLLSGDSIYFMLVEEYYEIGYYDEQDTYHQFTIYLDENKAYELNSTYNTIYIGLFTYDGLGLNRDWVRLYINDVRADFGFNVIQTETVELVVLDYFNNTLANETIDASAYSEYNLYAQVYSMYILNQFTYSDLIFNITQVGSGYYMNQLIPSSSALLYRFIPNINYTIKATYVNGTVYNIRTVNLTDNSQIESFGVPSAPSEYPKDVYFGVYTTTGLGIDHDLLRFYIDGDRTDFGFNRIENMIVTILVKDYFNSTLFNQNVNTSGIYEYNILITLYSLKIKNEARVSANYTLSFGALETTGYILPEEIIEYQLSSNNYVFDYTNNEDNSFHTININLNQNRVYILNTTYYNGYFSLYDLNLHIIEPSQYVFRLNGTIQDFGSIVDLQTDDYNITVVDRFGTSLFDSIVTLRGLNEYRIDITLYELQIRHLARVNGNLTLSETTNHNYFEFIMAPDSLRSFILGSSTYNITWLNNENGITTTYDFTLNTDYILTLNTSYYNGYFSLYDLNLHVIYPSQYVFRLNGTIQDFGLIVDLQTDDYNITVVDRFGTSLFDSIVTLRGLNEYRIDISLYELQIIHLARENSNLTLTEDISGNDYSFIMAPNLIKSIIVGSADYTLGWTNGENGLTTLISIALTEDRVVMLNTSYYNTYFDLFDLNLHVIYPSQYVFRLNGTIQDFGLIVDLQTDDYNITVVDRFGTSLFDSIVTLRGLNEYRIDISLYELQVSHLARYNSNLTLTEDISGNDYLFIMVPYSIKSIIVGSADYTLGWTNGENGLTTSISIALTEDRVVMLNTSYYNIRFNLFDINLHIIDLNQYEFRLNGTIQDFGLIVDLQTDDYSISVVDRFGTSLFDSIVTLRGLNEYRIDITLYELQIRHLARVNGNLTLSETTTHNYFEFIMSPNSLQSFILGSSTYNITWLNNENGITTTYDFTLNTDYILTLNTSYYNIHFNLFDVNLHTIDSSLYEFRLNGIIYDFGLIVDLQEDDYTIVVIDRFGISLFDSVITLRGLNEYRIDITLYEFQIRHLAREIGNMSLYETTIHNSFNFSMAPDTIRSFILGSSTYNITWTNGENGIETVYDINLNLDYILTLDTSYYNIHFSLFDLNLHSIYPSQYEFRLNGTIQDFNKIIELQTDDYNITVVDRFGVGLFNNIVTLRGLNEYRVNISLYELQIIHLARENSNLTLTEDISGTNYSFIMAPNLIKSIIVGSADYTLGWTNGENGLTTLISIALTEDRVVMLNTSYYDIYFSLYDLNLHIIEPSQYVFRLNGTIQDFGLIVDLSTDDYSISVVDRFGTSLFDSIVTLRGLNEYRIDISLYELQIRHLATENSNVSLCETTSHNGLNFSMAPDSLRSFILGSSTYNITWLNNENGITTTYDFTLNTDYILTLDTTFYDVYFSLYDQGGVRLDDSLFSLYVNTTRKDFGFVKLESNSTLIVVQDYLNVIVFNQVVGLGSLAEYNIIITVFEFQIRHLAFENSNLTLYETTTHNHINFSMSPDSLNKYVLSNSTYNITWINGENLVSTLYNITLDENYILTLDSTYFDVYFSAFNYDGLGLDNDLFRFYINGLRKDFGFNTLKQDTNNLKVLDYFNATLFDQNIALKQYAEYNIFVEVYALIINNNYSFSIKIEIEREGVDIDFEQIIGAQFGMPYRFLPNIEYYIKAYHINGTLLDERIVELDKNNKIVSFGFYSEEIPVIPDFNAPGIWLMIILILMVCGFAIAFTGYIAYRYRKKSESYRRSYADKVTLEAQTIKKFSQGTRIR